jgi:hypothetical protein
MTILPKTRITCRAQNRRLCTSFAFATLAHPAQAERAKLVALRQEAREAMAPKQLPAAAPNGAARDSG